MDKLKSQFTDTQHNNFQKWMDEQLKAFKLSIPFQEGVDFVQKNLSENFAKILVREHESKIQYINKCEQLEQENHELKRKIETFDSILQEKNQQMAYLEESYLQEKREIYEERDQLIGKIEQLQGVVEDLQQYQVEGIKQEESLYLEDSFTYKKIFNSPNQIYNIMSD